MICSVIITTLSINMKCFIGNTVNIGESYSLNSDNPKPMFGGRRPNRVDCDSTPERRTAPSSQTLLGGNMYVAFPPRFFNFILTVSHSFHSFGITHHTEEVVVVRLLCTKPIYPRTVCAFCGVFAFSFRVASSYCLHPALPFTIPHKTSHILA